MSSTKSIARRLKALMMRAMPLHMSCRELEEFMADYVDGTLPRYQRLRVALHLRICAICRRYLEAYRRTVELTRAVFREQEGELPDELVDEILQARKRDPG